MNTTTTIVFWIRCLPLVAAVATLPNWRAEAAGYGRIDTNYARPTFRQVAYPIRVISDGRGGLLWSFYNGGGLDGGNGSRVGNVLRTAESGGLDASFATGPLFAETMGTAVQADGCVLVGAALAGDVSANGVPQYHVFRLLTNGVLDLAYQSPVFGYCPRFMALQPDGRLVVGGSSGTVAPEPQSTAVTNTVRLNWDGSLDTSFHAPVLAGAARLAPVFAPPVVDRQGRILLAGAFSTVDGVQYPRLVRLQTNGVVDPNFAPAGFAVTTSSYIRGIVEQPDGKLVIAGYALRVTGNSTNYPLLRLNDDGTLDPGFALVDPRANGLTYPFSPSTTSPIRLLKADSQGRILAAGFRIARFLPDGHLDSAFQRLEIADPDGGSSYILGDAYWLEVLSDDSVLVPLSGPATVGGVFVKSAFRLTRDGVLDASFSQPNLEWEAYPSHLALQRDGKALVWGSFATVSATSHSNVVRLNRDGTVDPTYNFAAGRDVVGVRKAAAGPDGQLYAILDHGLTQASPGSNSFVRLRADGSVDPAQHGLSPPWYSGYFANPGLYVQDDRPLVWYNDEQSVVDGWLPMWRFRPDGDFDDDFDAPTNRLGSFDVATETVFVGKMDLLAMQPDRRLLAAMSFDATNYSLMRLQVDGAFDPRFTGPTARGGPPSIYSSSVYGWPGTWWDTPVTVVAAGASPFSAAAVQPDGRVILAGSFRQLGGLNLAGLARLNPDGSLDLNFPMGSGAANADTERPMNVERVVIDGLGRIWIAGDFNRFNGVSVKGLVRLTPAGTVDASFTPDPAFFHYGVPYLDPERRCDLALGPAGAVYLLGTFRRNVGEWPDALHRLLADEAPSLEVLGHQASTGTSLALHLADGIVYRLQGSTDLHQWSDLGIFTGTNSASFHLDSAASDLDSRFYRLQAP